MRRAYEYEKNIQDKGLYMPSISEYDHNSLLEVKGTVEGYMANDKLIVVNGGLI